MFYDLKSVEKIERMKTFVNMVTNNRTNIQFHRAYKTRYILVGDLTSNKEEKRMVSYQEISDFASEHNFEYIEGNT